MTDAVVVGAGPAGLAAAEVMAEAGLAVTVADAMPSPARKFLMAGKSGLNITKATDLDGLTTAVAPAPLRPILADFDAQAVQDWARGLGQDVFTGSSGRVFPVAMKASPLLRAWLARLDAMGVVLRRRWRWVGFDDEGGLTFETPEGSRHVFPQVTCLALGGASWARLGSDGAWTRHFPSEQIAPFKPANMGFQVDWSAHMAKHFGAPVKGVALRAGDQVHRGEFVISERGVEGSAIYAVSKAVRDGADLSVDLKPDLSTDAVRQRLSKRGKASLANHLRKALGLTPAQIALLHEFGRPLPDDLAPLIKALPIRHAGPRPMDEAISTAGGVKFDALTEGLMLRDRPGVFCAGEMLDWEAPTGGYLITTSMATGRWAGRHAVQFAQT
ncbi:TIGR03862 family flavoprotein [Shimia ponticola]|uniref:TIGR03862 family flavoprotein n=1 Tax=Shimia ponticola TaxID=2582893 RepID=UPI0011BDD8C2|nr:TIGR03862 family flavoprotein [Shimia ponticola]